MAQHTTIQLIDDLDESEASHTIDFALDGVEMTIDLNDDHASDLREALAPYVAAGRKVKRGTVTRLPRLASGTAPARMDRAQAQAMRTWARNHGYSVSDRGRISEKVVEAYHRRASA